MRVLIICTGNSCRSQMAAGFMHQLRPGWEVVSAGTFPAEQVHPLAVSVMAEVGIDISSQHPKAVETFVAKNFDYLITVCDDARGSCPTFVGKVNHRLHMGFPDPARVMGNEEQVLAVFRQVRDEIREGIIQFVEGKV